MHKQHEIYMKYTWPTPEDPTQILALGKAKIYQHVGIPGRPLPTFFLLFPIFSKYSYLFLFLLQNSYFFLFFHSFGIKNRYFQVCSYMTLGASVEKISASILHWNSIHIRADLNIGLTRLKHRRNVCTHLYLDL